MKRAGGGTVVVFLLLLYGAARATLGADFGDGAHVVALAVRMAQGDVPFRDEMNVQALGSIPAVPFAWAWIQTIGIDGIVLACRLYYVALTLVVGIVCFRALRTRFSPVAATAGLAVALTATPYNLLVVSYNTMPMLALVLACSATVAAAATGSRRWAACVGVCVALAGTIHPATLPAALTLGALAVVLVWRRRSAAVLVISGGATAVVVGGGLLIVAGAGSILETFAFTSDYQDLRLPPGDRLALWGTGYLEALLDWVILAAVVVAALACVPRVPARTRAHLTLLIPPIVTVAAVRDAIRTDNPLAGSVGASWVTLTAALLLVPVIVSAVSRHDRPVLQLLVLAVPPALVGTPVMAMLTSSGPAWGATVPVLSPLVLALVIGAVRAVEQQLPATSSGRAESPAWHPRRSELRRGSARLVGLTVVVALLVPCLHAFRSGRIWEQSQRIHGGANALLSTSGLGLKTDTCYRHVVDTWTRPGESLLAYGAPAIYLGALRPAATNLLWLGAFGAATQHTLDWMVRTGRYPDVVILHRIAIKAAGGWTRVVRTDPLIAWVAEEYHPVGSRSHLLVLRPGPSTTPERAAQWLSTPETRC